MDEHTIQDMLFYMKEKAGQMSSFKSHFKAGTSKYSHYLLWETRYQTCAELIEDYVFRRKQFDEEQKRSK